MSSYTPPQPRDTDRAIVTAQTMNQSGKVKITVTIDGHTDVKYVVGGYRHYVIEFRKNTYDHRTQTWTPNVTFNVSKRTNDTATAEREYRLQCGWGAAWITSTGPAFQIRKQK